MTENEAILPAIANDGIRAAVLREVNPQEVICWCGQPDVPTSTRDARRKQIGLIAFVLGLVTLSIGFCVFVAESWAERLFLGGGLMFIAVMFSIVVLVLATVPQSSRDTVYLLTSQRVLIIELTGATHTTVSLTPTHPLVTERTGTGTIGSIVIRADNPGRLSRIEFKNMPRPREVERMIRSTYRPSIA